MKITIILLFLALTWITLVAQNPVALKLGSSDDQRRKIAVNTETDQSFFLDKAANVSAGVYDSKGTLVRTLFSNVRYPAGRHALEWDRKDDFDKPAPEENYHIQVLSNNVTYTWEGVIGNTSTSFTGSTVHRGFNPTSSLVIAGDTAYYCNMYQEGNLPLNRFLTSRPQQNLPIDLYSGSTGTQFNATDGINIYWTQVDHSYTKNPNPKCVKSFVFATSISKARPVIFSAGLSVKPTYGPIFNSTIDTTTIAKDLITGIAVQKTGSYLFTVHSTRNEIHVLNKHTGALLQIITGITAPNKISLEGDNTLWVISSVNVVQKFTINKDGTLGKSLLKLSGLVGPIAIAVSPDNRVVAICDASTSQQVKAFSTTTGVAVWTLGTPGGYRVNPAVSSNKFYFTDATGGDYQYTFIAFAPDGSFWVGDTGNQRMLHYSSSTTYIEEIMYLNRPYTCSYDLNDSTRVFAGPLEFKVDYSKPLRPDNGSWRLIRNWGKGKGLYQLYTVVTLRNGKTYSIQKQADGQFSFIELNPKTGIRNTSIRADNWAVFDKLGNLYRLATSKGIQTWYQKKLTGFSENEPVYGNETIYVSTSLTSGANPAYESSRVNPLARTASGQLISFDGSVANNDAKYHLGAIEIGASDWKWKTAYSTTQAYSGPFPADGHFDTGNGMSALHGNGGGLALATGKHIFWNYYGEFWKASQTNKWNHVYDNGLLLGQFGITRPETNREIAPSGMAGNALYPALLAMGNKLIHIWHGDESYHSGLHRWKVSNLETIQKQIIPVTSSLPKPKEVSMGVDLLAKLPFNSTIMSGTAGWIRKPDGPNHSLTGDRWVVQTNIVSYLWSSIDLFVKFQSKVKATNYIEKEFGASTPASNWTLVGNISLEGSNGNSSQGGMYIDVLDRSEKTIARFQQTIVYKDSRPSSIMGNSGIIVNYDSWSKLQPTVNKMQPLVISRSGSKVTFQYANFAPITTDIQDNLADIASPSKLRLMFFQNSGTPTYAIDISKMRFISN